jgi:hypothetical protein
MTITFRPAVREGVPLLLGLAGGTGSGKTWSAMVLAKGLAGDKRFAVIDTENGRAKHYADTFDFDHADLHAPFRPETYTEAIAAADKADYPVIVVDSMSHEWAGDGGMLDWHEQEMGGQESKKMTAWIRPKAAHRKMVTALLQVRAHVILCFRAEPKVDILRENGRMKVVPKASLVGLDGWMPISEKNLPFELTVSALLMADAPGVPKPIKLPEQLKPFLPLDRPIGEEAGVRLAQWAAGDAAADPSPEEAGLADELLELADALGKREETAGRINQHRATDPAGHAEWLRAQITRARQASENREKQPELA